MNLFAIPVTDEDGENYEDGNLGEELNKPADPVDDENANLEEKLRKKQKGGLRMFILQVFQCCCLFHLINDPCEQCYIFRFFSKPSELLYNILLFFSQFSKVKWSKTPKSSFKKTSLAHQCMDQT